MRKILLASLLSFSFTAVFSQVTYIGIINHNTGTGSNNLFNNYVAVNQQCYVDWEVYTDGMTNMEACGFRSESRLILRRTGNNDSTSVVASAPIVVPGICAGKNGNNDHYYVDLGTYIDKPGRYSVEIQADLPNATYPFENASTKTTSNFSCPSAYYLTGTSGPTGNYYTPTGSCAGGPGLSDPVGGQGADMLIEIFPALHFFTVGEVAAYRQMVVLNGNFYDFPKGKFQPGNPTLPLNLNGTNGIASYGICPIVAAPQISIGGEINNFKRTDCGNADVTGAAIFYRMYKEGNIPPVFTDLALNFKDDCPAGANGPEGNTFPTGGSCQNGNNILDQRWQTIDGIQIMPASFALSDTGIWKIEFFTATYMKDCTGSSFTSYGDTAATSFTVNNPFVPGSSCGNVIPVILSSFTATAAANNNVLNWTVEEASQVKSFIVQQSFDGYTFSNIAVVPYINGKSLFNYTDVAYEGRNVFYRIIITEINGSTLYSSIVKVNSKGSGIKMSVQPSSQNLIVKLESFNKGKYSISIINTAGSVMLQNTLLIAANGNTHLFVKLKTELAHAVYYAVIRNERGDIIAKNSFHF